MRTISSRKNQVTRVPPKSKKDPPRKEWHSCPVPHCENHIPIGGSPHGMCSTHERFLNDLIYFLPRLQVQKPVEEKVQTPTPDAVLLVKENDSKTEPPK